MHVFHRMKVYFLFSGQQQKKVREKATIFRNILETSKIIECFILKQKNKLMAALTRIKSCGIKTLIRVATNPEDSSKLIYQFHIWMIS